MSTNQDNGNAAAMHAALVNLTRPTETDIRGLENIAKYAMNHSMYGGGVLQALCGAIREGKLALAAPPRNCDVGTPEEQGIRCLATMRHWRKAYQGDALITAIMKWAQMPYAEEEGSET